MAKYFDTPFCNSGDKTAVPDPSQPSGDVSYTDGWTSDYELDQATDPNAKDVSRQATNQVLFDVTSELKQWQEGGIRDYDATVNYPIGAETKGSDNQIYRAFVANGPATSVVDPVTDTSFATWYIPGFRRLTYITANDAAWAPHSEVKALTFTAIGAGGGGGGVDGQGGGTAGCAEAGAGGGASIIRTNTIDSTYNITIGAGGSGGAAGANNGSVGGNTTVVDNGPGTNVNIAANGGNGGGGFLASGASLASEGAAGGTASGGDQNLNGGPSTTGSVGGGNRRAFSNSGPSILGGGVISTVTGNATSATNPGEGGGAASIVNVTTNFAGGDGADGIVIIEEEF